MKILIDARLYGLENAGLGRYAVNLIDQIAKLDHKNDYVILLRKKYFEDLKLPKNFKKILAEFRHYSFREQLELPKIIKTESPDLTHFLHFNVPLWFKEKFVVTIHDLLMHKQKGLNATTLNPYFYLLKRIGYKAVFRKAAVGASKIIVPSQFVKSDVSVHYKLKPEKIHVIYEGVDESWFTTKSNVKALKDYGLEPGKYFMYVGSAYPHKNLQRVIEATLHQKDVVFAISCARNVFTERLEKLIKDLKAQGKVKLLGFVPDEDLKSLYAHSLGFVYASLTEGFGLPGLEAMASGTLLLASEIPVFKEVYKDNAIYFNPFDFSDIAKKMGLVKDFSSAKRKELVEKGQEFARNYSWKKMVQETLKIYNSLD